MRELAAIGERLEAILGNPAGSQNAAELLSLGEETLEHWVTARGLEPTRAEREGFRILALHRQGAQGDPSFNACRETCRELVYHYNLVTTQAEHEETGQRLKMMTLLARHLYLFIGGKMETSELGDFCCASKPLHSASEP